jgi:hypothetical protein
MVSQPRTAIEIVNYKKYSERNRLLKISTRLVFYHGAMPVMPENLYGLAPEA